MCVLLFNNMSTLMGSIFVVTMRNGEKGKMNQFGKGLTKLHEDPITRGPNGPDIAHLGINHIIIGFRFIIGLPQSCQNPFSGY